VRRLSISVLLLGLLTPATALAEPVLRVGADGTFIGAADAYAGGALGAVSFGYDTENEPFIILPEITGSFGYHAGDFSGPNARALVGMRFGLALSVEPSLITRGGYGHYTFGVELPPGVEADLGRHGAAFQSGLGLDYRISRDMTFGGELLYDLFIDGETGDLAHALLGGVGVSFWL
jgi:hypothetical protein